MGTGCKIKGKSQSGLECGVQPGTGQIEKTQSPGVGRGSARWEEATLRAPESLDQCPRERLVCVDAPLEDPVIGTSGLVRATESEVQFLSPESNLSEARKAHLLNS